MFVKPAAGLKIRDPYKKDHLPPEGREVADTDLYWHRCLMDGDVIVVPAVSEPETASPCAIEPSREAAPKPRRSTLPTDRSTEQ